MFNKSKLVLCTLGLGLISNIAFADNVKSVKMENPAVPSISKNDNVANYVQDSDLAANSGIEVKFPYLEQQVYKIYLQVGYVTDIKLAPGEQIKYVGGGDTMRWNIDTNFVGDKQKGCYHLFIKPIQTGISTNLIINTDKRVYQLILMSSGRYNPMVSWSYPKSDIEIENEQKIKDYSVINPLGMRFGFKISNKNLSWAPENGFRTDSKTYLKMKSDISNYELPAFFVLDEENKMILVSYRYHNGYFVVDRLFDKGVMILGNKKVNITWDKERG